MKTQLGNSSVTTGSESQSSDSKGRSRPPRGIMKVRTLEDSLHKSYVSCGNHSKGDDEKKSFESSASCTACADQSDRSIAFHTVEIREYPRCLGDNPAVSCGPPITFAWDYDPSHCYVFPVEEYEMLHPSRRHQLEMVMPRSLRENVLIANGHSRSEISAAVKDARVVKNKRKASNSRLKRLGVNKIEEIIEDFKCVLFRLPLFCCNEKRSTAPYYKFVKKREQATRDMLEAEEEHEQRLANYGESVLNQGIVEVDYTAGGQSVSPKSSLCKVIAGSRGMVIATEDCDPALLTLLAAHANDQIKKGRSDISFQI